MEPAATQTSTTGSKHGFTTIELMVTLVIIAIMSTVVVVSMGPTLEEARMRSACRTVASALNYARSFAVAHKSYTRVVLDKQENGVYMQTVVRDESGDQSLEKVTTPMGRLHRLPEGTKIAEIHKPGIDVEENYVGFTDIGQADDTMITISGAGDKERYIAVESITGRATIKVGEK